MQGDTQAPGHVASGLSVGCQILGTGTRLQGQCNCPPYNRVKALMAITIHVA